MLEAVRRRSLEFVAGLLFNDFQPVALDASPEIRRAFDILRARVGPTLLCGSGAALFALPGSDEDALIAIQALQNDGYQAWHVRFAPFGSSID
jgi:4-diphosphocytidyl-2C-methyl-D-erythritol kinase